MSEKTRCLYCVNGLTHDWRRPNEGRVASCTVCGGTGRKKAEAKEKTEHDKDFEGPFHTFLFGNGLEVTQEDDGSLHVIALKRGQRIFVIPETNNSIRIALDLVNKKEKK